MMLCQVATDIDPMSTIPRHRKRNNEIICQNTNETKRNRKTKNSELWIRKIQCILPDKETTSASPLCSFLSCFGSDLLRLPSSLKATLSFALALTFTHSLYLSLTTIEGWIKLLSHRWPEGPPEESLAKAAQ